MAKSTAMLSRWKIKPPSVKIEMNPPTSTADMNPTRARSSSAQPVWLGMIFSNAAQPPRNRALIAERRTITERASTRTAMLELSGEGLVQQRLLQGVQRGELL